ncbi:MAG: dipeptide epimerase [Chloroflexi bacterium]|nr:dipeptide epimerase [Chloroflexota bacterium]
MKLSWEIVTLSLKTPFRIAHGVSKQRQNVIVHLDEGLGEAAAVSYHGETPAGIAAYLDQLSTLPDIDPQHLVASLAALPPGSPAARAGVDMALHDLWGKRLGHPLYRLLGLDPQDIPPTSFTIAMDTPQVMAQQAQASGMPILKIKVGVGEDEARIQAIRQVTEARLRLDANGGWSREQAARLIPRLAEYGLELVEQPLAVGDIEGLKWLRQQGFGVPIFADESIKTPADVIAHAGAVDGVVIKLAKSGGIRGALQAIAVARALDMQVMVSCMVETAIGVTAAAHLAALCDYVDLDGPLLIANDPYVGVNYDGARLILPDTPGLGVHLAAKPEQG